MDAKSRSGEARMLRRNSMMGDGWNDPLLSDHGHRVLNCSSEYTTAIAFITMQAWTRLPYIGCIIFHRHPCSLGLPGAPVYTQR